MSQIENSAPVTKIRQLRCRSTEVSLRTVSRAPAAEHGQAEHGCQDSVVASNCANENEGAEAQRIRNLNHRVGVRPVAHTTLPECFVSRPCSATFAHHQSCSRRSARAL